MLAVDVALFLLLCAFFGWLFGVAIPTAADWALTHILGWPDEDEEEHE
jgi:hypothetical protein